MKLREKFEQETGMVLPNLNGMPSVKAYIQGLEQRLEDGQVEPIVPCPGRDLQASKEPKAEGTDTVESERSIKKGTQMIIGFVTANTYRELMAKKYDLILKPLTKEDLFKRSDFDAVIIANETSNGE